MVNVFELDVVSVNPQLENIIISNITSNKRGEAWCATDAGIIYYNQPKGHTSLITKKEGLPEEYLIFQKPYYNTSEDIQMITSGKIITIDKEKLFLKEAEEKAIITSVNVNNENIYSNLYLAEEQGIQLDHDQNDIEISYSHTASFQKDGISYYYKMEGINDQWIDVKNTKTARFYELDPGNYNFQLLRSFSPSNHQSLVSLVL